MLGSELVKVKKGSMITSQKKLCKQFRWGNSKLRSFLKVLQKDKMLLLETNTQSTQITICNYDTYQDKQISNKPQTNHKQTANKLRTNTNNNVNKDNNVNNNKRVTTEDIKNIIQDDRLLKLYGYRMLEEFIDYWVESDGKKAKHQMRKTFDIPLRLKTWSKKDYNGMWKRHKEDLMQIEQDEYLKNASKNAHKTPEYQNKEIKNMISGIGKKV